MTFFFALLHTATPSGFPILTPGNALLGPNDGLPRGVGRSNRRLALLHRLRRGAPSVELRGAYRGVQLRAEEDLPVNDHLSLRSRGCSGHEQHVLPWNVLLRHLSSIMTA